MKNSMFNKCGSYLGKVEEYAKYYKKMTQNVLSDVIFIKIPNDTCIPVGLKDNSYELVYFPQNYDYEIIKSDQTLMSYDIVKLNFKR